MTCEQVVYQRLLDPAMNMMITVSAKPILAHPPSSANVMMNTVSMIIQTPVPLNSFENLPIMIASMSARMKPKIRPRIMLISFRVIDFMLFFCCDSSISKHDGICQPRHADTWKKQSNHMFP